VLDTGRMYRPGGRRRQKARSQMQVCCPCAQAQAAPRVSEKRADCICKRLALVVTDRLLLRDSGSEQESGE
jgi:hypothetical protein